jgi:hypothetical protein
MGELIIMAEKKNRAAVEKTNEQRDAASRLKQLTKLVAEHRELMARLSVITDEIDRVLQGRGATFLRIVELESYFATLWSSVYHEPYVFKAHDRDQLKRVFRATGDEEIIKRRMLNYIQNSDAFYGDRRHPFGMFISTFNQHANEATSHDLGDAVADCRHVPRCVSDQQHTARRRRELRAS